MGIIRFTVFDRPKILREIENHKDLLSSLEIDNAFIADLIDAKGDMQFIVRLAVIAEGGAAAVVRKTVQPADLAEWIVKKTTHSERLDLLRELRIIEPENSKALMKLATIRNAFAHKPGNLKKTLEVFYNEQTPDWQRELQDSLSYALAETRDLDNKQKGDVFDDTGFKSQFRLTILTAMLVPLYQLAAALR